MIAKNEEHNLHRALTSVKGCVDEIVFVDTGSADASKAIAAEYGCAIYDYQWNNDFAAARNYPLTKATKDWILYLDADQEILPDSAIRLRKSVATAEQGNYDTIAVEMRDMGPDGKPCVSFLENIIWKRSDSVRFRGRIHEVASVKLPALDLGLQGNHYGYVNLDSDTARRKSDRNYMLLLEELGENPDDLRLIDHLARELFQRGDHNEALEWLDRGIGIFRAGRSERIDHNFFFLKAGLLNQRGDYEGAIQALDEGLGIMPDNFDLYYMKASVLSAKKDYSGTVKSLLKYLELRKLYMKGRILRGERSMRSFYCLGKALVLLASCYLRQGNYSEGMNFLLTAYREGEDELVLNLLAEMRDITGTKSVLGLTRGLAAERMSEALAVFIASLTGGLDRDDAEILAFFYKKLREFEQRNS